MGNLIKVLSRDIDNNAGNFFLDFESKWINNHNLYYLILRAGRNSTYSQYIYSNFADNIKIKQHWEYYNNIFYCKQL